MNDQNYHQWNVFYPKEYIDYLNKDYSIRREKALDFLFNEMFEVKDGKIYAKHKIRGTSYDQGK
jgi:hypothetical protein